MMAPPVCSDVITYSWDQRCVYTHLAKLELRSLIYSLGFFWFFLFIYFLLIFLMALLMCNNRRYFVHTSLGGGLQGGTWSCGNCPGGGYSRIFFIEMCRWENENWPIHLPILDPKLDPYIYQNSFTRGVKMGPYSAARPQYLFLPEYPRG